MSDSGISDEIDLRILHALQLAPRGSWSGVGRALSIGASTAARRWRRLEEEGIGWVTCHPPREPETRFGMIEIDCEYGKAEEVARELCADPCAYTIDLASGSTDLLVVVAARSYEALASYALGRFQKLRHVRAVRTYMAVRTFTNASRWRLGALDSSQQGLIRRTFPKGEPAPWTELSGADWEMALELGRDGRASITRLSEVTGMNESTTRRRLERLLGSGQLTLRTEVARSATATPVHAVFYADAPVGQLEYIAGLLMRRLEVRAAFSSVGPFNLGFVVWVSSLEHLQQFEKHITQGHYRLVIRDRMLILRSVKRVGRILDSRDRAVGHTPADLRYADG
ncbi:Lrp/AsnC family transcriptional regulator [Streptomyces sp. H27-C3]|uniref:Lrp/AsnC family transcriptional regulator n=1 Tax=Streptomyces sp. H27-C3 TaxID=3046305 RepID=UPI0024BA4EB9|nr:Lrp/AsnC family transcriptional regulator [Streptomyces sp. H27-C3]MDJ0466884.1 Lrp/AsnC family transcriptional regulator [Streptomyces sp. H27-C3]